MVQKFTQKRDKYHSPTTELNVLDTTGAGDSFAAGFITAFYNKKEIEECLNQGNQSASICVTNLGALDVSKFR